MTSIDDIKKAKKYITDIRDENYIKLDNFQKAIDANRDTNITYNTSVYDNRISNCNIILETLERAIPKTPIIEKWNPALCPSCESELSELIGDGCYNHFYNLKFCNCGQRLRWKDNS